MSFLPISSQASGLKPVNIAQIFVAGLLPFVLTGCSSPKLAVASVEPIPFWAMEYTVRTGESDRMAVTYGWRYVPVVKERVETYLSEGDRKHADVLFQSVLEHNPTGVTSSWDNFTTGHSGTVTPTRTVTPKDQPPCRDFVIVVNIGGNEAHGYGRYFRETGTACRENVGIWQVLKD
jgi:surface antigen